LFGINPLDRWRTIEQVTGVVVTGAQWAFLTGEWLNQLKPLVFKKHGRKEKSLFRYGFDYLRNILLNPEQKMDEFSEVLRFSSCT